MFFVLFRFALLCFIFGPLFIRFLETSNLDQEHGKYLDIQVPYCMSALCFFFINLHHINSGHERALGAALKITGIGGWETGKVRD